MQHSPKITRFIRSTRHLEKVAKARAKATPDTFLTLCDKIGNAVIFRINYPKLVAGKMSRAACLKAKLRPLLSVHDVQDVKQEIALVLHATGALERGKLELSDWTACFRVARALLRIDTHHTKCDAVDVATLDTMSETDAIGAACVSHTRVDKMQFFRRSAIARKASYMRACINAAFHADTSRKASANRRNALLFLRYVTSQYSLGMGQAEILGDCTPEAAYMKRNRFEKYLANGEAALDAIAEKDIESRSKMNCPRGSFKTFQAI